MEKCVYCGKGITQQPIKAMANTRKFSVCSEQCKDRMETYIKQDKKYKLIMYMMIFVGGCGFLISALFGKGSQGMLVAYLGQILAGVAFLLFPYPIISFETFFSVPIKKVTMISKILGSILIVWGLMLIFAL